MCMAERSQFKKPTTFSGRQKQPTLKPPLATSEGPIDLLGVGS
jgi:hypothetical protein